MLLNVFVLLLLNSSRFFCKYHMKQYVVMNAKYDLEQRAFWIWLSLVKSSLTRNTNSGFSHLARLCIFWKLWHFWTNRAFNTLAMGKPTRPILQFDKICKMRRGQDKYFCTYTRRAALTQFRLWPLHGDTCPGRGEKLWAKKSFMKHPYLMFHCLALPANCSASKTWNLLSC